jgi:hypothetical protein
MVREAKGNQLNYILGDTCGSSFIDLEFKKWLYDLIGPEYYRKLDPRRFNFNSGSHDVESGQMRELMKKFDGIKRKFRSDYRNMRLDLPDPLHNLTIEGRVRGGEITISKYVMSKLRIMSVADHS